MSPTLLKKYLEAAREVASHMFLKPTGFAFAPHAMLAETDRDKYCVQQIIDFYHQQNTDYVDYFAAAWRYKHRAALGRPDATLADVAADARVSAKYLATVWSVFEGPRGDDRPAGQAAGDVARAARRRAPSGADTAARRLRGDARLHRRSCARRSSRGS